MYTYKAKIISVPSGDTVKANIDLGFNNWIKNQILTLDGIDLQLESKSEHLSIRDKLKQLVLKKRVLVQTIKLPNSRWEAKIFLEKNGKQTNVNDILINNEDLQLYML